MVFRIIVSPPDLFYVPRTGNFACEVGNGEVLVGVCQA